MEFKGRPIANGNSAQSTVGVSPETIAQQFCHVASDMRALLKETQNTKEQLASSIEIQQGIGDRIDTMTAAVTKMTTSVNDLTSRMLEFMDVMKDFIDHNHEVVDELTENSLIIAATYKPKDSDLDALQTRITPRMEQKRANRERRLADRRARRTVSPGT